MDNGLRDEVNKIIEAGYDIEFLPKYMNINGEPVHHTQLPGSLSEDHDGKYLPKGNNGLGLRLLGLSGSDVLPPEVYAQIKAKALSLSLIHI